MGGGFRALDAGVGFRAGQGIYRRTPSKLCACSVEPLAEKFVDDVSFGDTKSRDLFSSTMALRWFEKTVSGPNPFSESNPSPKPLKHTS